MGLTYKPREAFVPFHNRDQRWAALNTHRRAGKTVALVNDLILGALECPLYRPQLAYIGPTYGQAKRVAWQYLKDYSEQYWDGPPLEGELKLKLVGDRTIYCLGSDNPEAIRGMYLDGGVGDEYALFKPSVFSAIIRPALSDRNGWFAFTSTPRGKNAFHRICQTARKNPKEYYYLQLSADKSGIIAPRELADLRMDMDSEEFAQEYLCSFDSALKGAIYANEINEVFLEGRVRKGLFDVDLPVYIVFDLGFTDSTVAIYYQRDHQGWIRIIGVVASSGQDIFKHIEDIEKFPAEISTVYLPHDAKAKNLQTGMSIVEQFLEHKLRPEMVPQHKIRDRLAAARRVFPRVLFEEETTEDLIEGLKGYRRRFDEKSLSYADVPFHDWCSDYADAFGYLSVVEGQTHGQIRIGTKVSEAEMLKEYNLANLFADNEARRYGQRRMS